MDSAASLNSLSIPLVDLAPFLNRLIVPHFDLAPLSNGPRQFLDPACQERHVGRLDRLICSGPFLLPPVARFDCFTDIFVRCAGISPDDSGPTRTRFFPFVGLRHLVCHSDLGVTRGLSDGSVSVHHVPVGFKTVPGGLAAR